MAWIGIGQGLSTAASELISKTTAERVAGTVAPMALTNQLSVPGAATALASAQPVAQRVSAGEYGALTAGTTAATAGGFSSSLQGYQSILAPTYATNLVNLGATNALALGQQNFGFQTQLNTQQFGYNQQLQSQAMAQPSPWIGILQAAIGSAVGAGTAYFLKKT